MPLNKQGISGDPSPGLRRFLLLGANANNNSNAGAFCGYWNNGAGASYWNYSARPHLLNLRKWKIQRFMSLSFDKNSATGKPGGSGVVG